MALSVPRSGLVAVLAVLVVVLAVAVGFALTSGTAAADTAPESADRGIRVVGVGTASGAPDVLRFTVGVEVTADTVDAALSSANQAAERTIAVLKDRGVQPRDLQTASVQIQPRYADTGQQITGYVVRQDLVVTARDLAAAGGLISAAVEAGGDAARLSGVSYALEDDETVLAAARDNAFATARSKAEQYARLSGQQLAEVVSIAEDVSQGPLPFARTSAPAASAAPAVPLEAGSTEVSVSVDVRWAVR